MAFTLDELHRALGRVVYEWSHLETQISLLVFNLCAVKSPAFYEDEGVGQVVIAISSNIELRAATAICKTLAHGVDEPANYFALVEKTLNNVEGNLRIKRNRFVHDRWVVLHDKVVRYQEGSAFPKEPGTGKTMMVHGRAEEYLSIADIESVADEIAESRKAVGKLKTLARFMYLKKYPREELPQPPRAGIRS